MLVALVISDSWLIGVMNVDQNGFERCVFECRKSKVRWRRNFDCENTTFGYGNSTGICYQFCMMTPSMDGKYANEKHNVRTVFSTHFVRIFTTNNPPKVLRGREHFFTRVFYIFLLPTARRTRSFQPKWKQRTDRIRDFFVARVSGGYGRLSEWIVTKWVYFNGRDLFGFYQCYDPTGS